MRQNNIEKGKKLKNDSMLLMIHTFKVVDKNKKKL